jgi:hypothetical protein
MEVGDLIGCSSSPAGATPVRVAARGPVAGWRLDLETGRVGVQCQTPRWRNRLSGPQNSREALAKKAVHGRWRRPPGEMTSLAGRSLTSTPTGAATPAESMTLELTGNR